MPTARPAFKYAVVAADYFTKWAEAKPLTVISSKKVQEFIWEYIRHSLIATSFVTYATTRGSRKASLQLITLRQTVK